MEIPSIKWHQQVVSMSTELIKVKENRIQKWKVRRKQDGASDARRQKQSGGNRMLSNQAHWNIHHPALLVFPSYLPFQSVLCPPVSQPLRQPDPLQLTRGFLKVPNACLAKDSFSHLPLDLLDGWSRAWTFLPPPPPPSVLCVQEKGDVCNRTLFPVSYAVENCWMCCWQRERFGSTPDLLARHYQEVHWPASPLIAHRSACQFDNLWLVVPYPWGACSFSYHLNKYDSHQGFLNAFNLLIS